MAGLLGNGLMGMGGLGGMSQGMPPGLLKNPMLSQLFDPTAMRNYQIKQGLMSAGAAMMNPDPRLPPSGIGGVIGRAAAGGFQGANQAGQDFYGRGMQNAQLLELDREYSQRDQQQKAMEELIPTLPPHIQSFARAYPQQFGEAWMKAQMPGEGFTLGENQVRYGPDGKPIATGPKGTPKPPTIETFYDEKTGQSFKGQWNAETQSWDRVGGNKADENGITITNPDGTVTQIGGSGSKTTEGDRRANLLIQQIVAQEPQLMASFDTLASALNAIGSATGQPGRAIMTGEAQVAKDSITNVVANWLYLTSGATATDEEVARQTAMVTPAVTDKPETIAAKKARLQSIIDTMKIRGNVQPNEAQPKRYRYNPATGELE